MRIYREPGNVQIMVPLGWGDIADIVRAGIECLKDCPFSRDLRLAIDAYDGESPAASKGPKVTEDRVPGHLLIRFDEEWPAGWCWEDEPLWSECEEDEEDGVRMLETDEFYNLSEWELTFQGSDGKGNQRCESLWFLFRKWWRKQDDYDGARP